MAFVKLYISSLASLFFIGVSSESIGKTLRLHPHEHAGSALDVHSADVFGSTMSRIFTKYEGLPVGANALFEAGWKKSGCDENLGYAWTKKGDSKGNALVTTDEPLKLYTNADGQPSGVGTIIRKYLPPSQRRYTTKESVVPVKLEDSDDYWHLDVAFRSGNQCQSGLQSEEIGDKLILNPGAADSADSVEIPLNNIDAVKRGWQKGSCFDGMGWHYFYNTKGGSLPMNAGLWNRGDLLPVVAMYYKGKINAIFFAAVTSQSSGRIVPRRNKWEPANLPDNLMCANFCGECGFKSDDLDATIDMSAWSTMHVYFNDHNEVQCAADSESELKCVPFTKFGCCEKNAWVDRSLALVKSETEFQPFANQGGIWVAVGGGLGLIVSVVAAFIVKRRQISVRTVQASELVA